MCKFNIYISNIRKINEDNIRNYFHYFSDYEKKISMYKRKEDKLRSLLGLHLVKMGLENMLNNSIDYYDIKRNNKGRLYYNNHWSGDFNISHSGDLVICALIEFGRIGIDIEEIKSFDYRLTRYCFNKEEREFFNNLDTEMKTEFFYDIWTLKEAFLKAIGEGLCIPMHTFGFDMDRYKENNIKLIINSSFSKKEWYFVRFKLNENYKVSICSNQSDILKICNYLDIVKFHCM
ncbi:4'-phosphopantetheinyl transferase family protein [Bacillus pseudomycoides]|uniref:4'-phosphopantetheinyl transferase family protein n=1 Tax=Bacillus pseudomycoides TaxID=64104 RepID=UPI000BF7A853|nr:4'-phosphopantetheinyl transferase superfamily protein [Bacillus pseudomycoides]PEP84924.1 hypothetical protein CN584_13680 [Bacillus pseudomycoides]